jgi:hypothetical protein
MHYPKNNRSKEEQALIAQVKKVRALPLNQELFKQAGITGCPDQIKRDNQHLDQASPTILASNQALERALSNPQAPPKSRRA